MRAQPYGGERGYKHESWNNVEGYKVDLDAVRSWGVPLTSLDQFLAQNRDKFVIGGALTLSLISAALSESSEANGGVVAQRQAERMAPRAGWKRYLLFRQLSS